MARREHSYNSGRIHRAGDSGEQVYRAESSAEPARQYTGGGAVQRAAAKPAPKRAQQKAYAGGGTTRKRRWPKVVLAVVIVLAAAVIGVLLYIDNVVNTGNTGAIVDNNFIPKTYAKKKDVTNFLIVGIDYNDERSDMYTSGLGLTDMILYCNFDHVNNKLNMLQIPRDSYPGELVDTGGSGKINALLACGADKENPINNLAEAIETQYKLPVDNYIALDMDGLVSIVDALGFITVNIPTEMYFDGSYLPAGEVNLTGPDVEFFVRNRSGEGFSRGDPDRLNNQRLFYAGLFKRLKNMSAGDLVNLLPSMQEYITTDFSATDLLDVAQKLKAIDSSNILFCMAPGATTVEGVWYADPTGSARFVYATDWYGRQIWQASEDPENTEGKMVTDPENPGLANILNEHFRAHGDLFSADELGPQDESDPGYHLAIPENVTLYPANVQAMSDLGGAPAADGDAAIQE